MKIIKKLKFVQNNLSLCEDFSQNHPYVQMTYHFFSDINLTLKKLN